MALKIDLRELVVHRIARDIANRPGLGVRVPHEAAARVVARRSHDWLRLFLAASNEPNTFKTKRELAAEAGATFDQCDTFWRSLRGIEIDTPAGRKRLFRDDVELRFRHTGRVGGATVLGGVCLHLSNQEPMSLDLNRTITATTKPAVRTMSDNFAGATRRMADDASVGVEERADIEREAEEAFGGVRSRDTLPLFGRGTGTDGQ